MNNVKIKRVQISNFRSFAPTEKNIVDEDLAGVNLFVGPNGGGKSNFFNAIRWCVRWGSFNSQGAYDLEYSYYDPNRPIDIVLSLGTPDGSQQITLHAAESLGRECWDKATHSPDLRTREQLRQRIFPIGLPRQFRNIFDRKDDSYERIRASWAAVVEDAKSIDLSLPVDCPPLAASDRVLYEISDTSRIPYLEGSDGFAQFLYLVIHIRILQPGSVVLIEEPDISMHPGLQKELLKYLRALAKNERYQFLVTTHSPYLMDLAIESEDVAVYRIFKEKKGNAKPSSEIVRLRGEQEKWNLLQDLGHSPSDVMQPNGIIWVEGPSDVVYLSTWLGKLAQNLIPHKHYEILTYGGANVAHIGFWRKTGTAEKIINLFDLNPNFAFIVDSDSDHKKYAEKMKSHKKRIVNECKRANRFNWVTNPCIERYVMDFMGWQNYLRRDKPKKAHAYREKVEQLNKSEVERHLKRSRALEKVMRLVAQIESWDRN